MKLRARHPSAPRALLIAALLAPGMAAAQSCTVSATAVAFGTYNPLSASPAESNGTVTLNCSSVPLSVVTPYTVALSAGNQGSFVPRRMAAGANLLQYQLYTDLARTTPWGDGSAGTSVVNGTIPPLLLSSVSLPHTVYGRVPALQSSAAVGSYSDVITVTVTY